MADDDMDDEDEVSEGNDVPMDGATLRYQEDRASAMETREQQLNEAVHQQEQQVVFLEQQLRSAQIVLQNLKEIPRMHEEDEEKATTKATEFQQLQQQQQQQLQVQQEELLGRIKEQLDRVENQ